jgi:hypothetical protein
MKLQSQRQSFIRLAEFQLRNRAEKCSIGFVFGRQSPGNECHAPGELDRDAPFSMRDEGCIVVTNQLREGFSP